MENSAGAANSPQPATAQRSIRLRRALIRTNGKRLQRTAEFTDGSTRAVEMTWSEIQRVAAFRRDVMSDPVLCVAITDTRQVVVLDESMDGWKALLESLSQHLVESQGFGAWSTQIEHGSAESYWSILFSAVG